MQEIGAKRDRALDRRKGGANLVHYLRSMVPMPVHTKEGLYLGQTLAFNLDQPTIDCFMERMGRGILFHENKVGYVPCNIRWRLSYSVEEFEQLSQQMKQLRYSGILRSIGKDILRYVASFYPGRAGALIIIEFFQGFEVMLIVREEERTEKAI